MTPDFMVLGLPRSGTAWLANWLTTDRSLCLHDPFNELPEHWPHDGRRWGISCTGAYLLKGWVGRQACPIAVIERDPADCLRSLRALYPDAELDGLAPALNAVRGRRWRFSDLWEERAAQVLWEYVLPGLPFDAIRYRLLRELNVQAHKWELNADVVGELIERGLMDKPAQAKEKAQCPGGTQQPR